MSRSRRSVDAPAGVRAAHEATRVADELSMVAMSGAELRRTACSFDCFDACGVVAEVKDGRILRLAGDPAHPFTRGALCQKVNRYLGERYYSGERIVHPLRRTAGGWERIAWDDALDLAAARLEAARRRHGSLAVLYHKGNGSFAALKVLGERFFNLHGGATHAVGRYCAGEGDLGTTQSFGRPEIHDPRDLAEHTRFFLIWGRNPAVTNIHMMPVLRAARARGAVAVLVDPVETKTARYCDRAIHPRPGSDGHLAIGLAKVILARREVDRARIAAVSEHFDDYLRLVDGVSMEEVVRRTDLPLATVEWLAVAYFDTRPATILQGVGLQQYTRGAQTYRLIAALGMLAGHIGVSGGGVNFANWPWPKMRHVVAEDRRTAPPRTVPVSRLGEGLAATADPPITLGFFMGSNLVNQMPDPPGARAALARLDFVVCVDQFLTDTADTAHLFLPSTTFLEEEDVLPSYGHHWMQLMQPVVEPLGEARSDLWILQRLAERLGFGPGMAGTPGEWIDRVTEPFRHQGISYAALRAAGGLLWPTGTPRVPWADGEFATPSGRFAFPDRLDDDPVLPPRDYPLHLLALATEKATNSQILEARQAGAAVARVHPRLAADGGFGEGDDAVLVSPRGRLHVRLALDPGTRPDTVLVQKGEWLRCGRCLNLLTEPRFTAGTGAAFNQNFVRLERP
jgi:anaerobic selenocysteine-containing dehydrogenase